MDKMLQEIKDKYSDHHIDIHNDKQLYIDEKKVGIMWQTYPVTGISYEMRLQIEKAMFNNICEAIDKIIKENINEV